MNEPFSIRKRLKSFVYAGAGIRKLVCQEHNAWIHCCAITVTTAAGFYFGISRMEWIAVVLCFALSSSTLPIRMKATIIADDSKYR